jgi:hypothetical protein
MLSQIARREACRSPRRAFVVMSGTRQRALKLLQFPPYMQ